MGGIARRPVSGQEQETFSDKELQQIREAIRGKYLEVSTSAEGKFKYVTGKAGAVELQYDAAILNTLDAVRLESFCGVGNPFSLGEIQPGSVVLDVGCGGGLDMLFAAKYAGPEGRVCGIDLTEEMVRRARENLAHAGIDNAELQHVSAEKIPYADNTFDVVISNGVINLSPCKEELFQEIYRVLKPGGRLHFADIVLENQLPASMAASVEAWSQ